MPHIEKHAPGTFCWIELGTTDQGAAKQFYGSLFGWSASDFPMGPGGTYTTFMLDGRNAAAAYQLGAATQTEGVPPHWMLYVTVTSTDETAKRAGELGAKVLAGPMDVFDFGRMAVIMDPTGAAISIWEPKQHIGTTIEGVHGTMCWADLSTGDEQAAGNFYTQLFGWTLDPGKDGSGYMHINAGGHGIGGIPPSKYKDPNVPPHWLTYFWVDDVDATAAKATGMGAKLLMPPTTMEGVGRMSFIQDPQGAVFAIFHSAHGA
jgi:predicted enzyme related to lactoylglutathione lyase